MEMICRVFLTFACVTSLYGVVVLDAMPTSKSTNLGITLHSTTSMANHSSSLLELADLTTNENALLIVENSTSKTPNEDYASGVTKKIVNDTSSNYLVIAVLASIVLGVCVGLGYFAVKNILRSAGRREADQISLLGSFSNLRSEDDP